MTYQQPPVVPGPKPPADTSWIQTGSTPPPGGRKRGLLLWLIGSTSVAFLAIGALAFALTGGSAKPTASPSATAPLPQDRCGGGICQTEPVAEATTPRVTYTPTTDDLQLKAKITEKDCFGSAGCNVTFRPDVTYTGTVELDPDITWLVVYDINGVEDAPQVGHLTVQGTQTTFDEDVVSTKSSKSKITLKVTSVEEQ